MNPTGVVAAGVVAIGILYLLLRKKGGSDQSLATGRDVSEFSKIWVVGDSIAQGLAAQVPSELRGDSITHSGAQMLTVQHEIYANWQNLKLNSNDLILINVGTNDVYGNPTMEVMVERVRAFWQNLEMLEPDAGKLWALPPAAASAKYDKLRLAILQEGIPYVELADPAGYLAPDGIHMSPAGYKAYIDQILTASL